jgi:ubiquinone/menaquinone biosynthesis C-methylase UbiE
MRPATETPAHDAPPNRVVAEFNAMADTFDTRHFLRISAHRLVDRMTLPVGAQVLDVATGTGWAALAAAQRVGPTGTVVGIDLAPALLERARQKAAAAGLTQVAFQTGDAARLDCADQRFDVVLCATALFFVPDMLAALREWARVLRPGGQVGFSAWGPTYRQPLQGLWDARLQQYGVARPASAPDSAGNRRLADLATCRQLLHEVGFEPIDVEREHVAYAFRTAEEWWAEMSTSRSGLAVLQLAPAQRAQFQAAHLTEVAALATAHGIEVDVAINITRGWKRAA